MLYILSFLYFFLANPKSPILAWDLESMTFAGFKSLNNKLLTYEQCPTWPMLESHYKSLSTAQQPYSNPISFISLTDFLSLHHKVIE